MTFKKILIETTWIFLSALQFTHFPLGQIGGKLLFIQVIACAK